MLKNLNHVQMSLNFKGTLLIYTKKNNFNALKASDPKHRDYTTLNSLHRLSSISNTAKIKIIFFNIFESTALSGRMISFILDNVVECIPGSLNSFTSKS